MDQLLAQERIASNVSQQVLWILPDHLGSTRELVDTLGKVVAHYQYDSFCVLLDGRENVTRYQFTGREHDGHTDLNYHRARWYDPLTGKWMSEDPSSFLGKDVNLSRYSANNVLNGTDPSGLIFESLWDLFSVGCGVVEIVVARSWVAVGGLVVDVGALVIPGVPGGAGAALNATRAAKIAAKAGKVTDAVGTGVKVTIATGRAGRAAKATQTAAAVIEKMPYKEMKKLKSALGIGNKFHAHHIIEKRFLNVFKKLNPATNADEWMAVAMDPATHQKYTNLWKEVIPTKRWFTLVPYPDYSPAQILAAARIVYKDAPEILANLKLP